MAEIKLSADAIEDLKKIKSYIAEELCNETAALHPGLHTGRRTGSAANACK